MVLLGKLLITLLIFMTFAMPPAFIWATASTDPADTEDGDTEDSTGPIEAFPNKVKFELDAEVKPRNNSLNISLLNNNITRTLSDIDFTDLISNINAGDSVSGKVFNASLPSGSLPRALNQSTTTVLSLKYNLTQQPYAAGTYDGDMILYIEGVEPLTIPIQMVIPGKTESPQSEPTEISAESIEAAPSEVKFELDAHKVSGPLTKNILLFLKNNNQTANITKYDVTDLDSDNNGASSITGDAFKLTLSTGLILNYDPKPIRVNFTPPKGYPAGTYSGDLFLIDEGSNPVNKAIPIKVQVNAVPLTLGSSPWPILCILAGVAVNVIYFLAQEGRRIRDKVTTGIDKAFYSLETAISDRRMSKDEMIYGIRSFNRGTKKFVEEGDYSEAILEFDQAKTYFDKAKSDEDSQINVQIPTREPVYKRMRRSLSLTLAFRRDKLIVIGFAIVLIITVLTILSSIQEQENADVILQFDDPVVGGILAFLLGYGASAVTEQIYPFFGRKDEV